MVVQVRQLKEKLRITTPPSFFLLKTTWLICGISGCVSQVAPLSFKQFIYKNYCSNCAMVRSTRSSCFFLTRCLQAPNLTVKSRRLSLSAAEQFTRLSRDNLLLLPSSIARNKLISVTIRRSSPIDACQSTMLAKNHVTYLWRIEFHQWSVPQHNLRQRRYSWSRDDTVNEWVRSIIWRDQLQIWRTR